MSDSAADKIDAALQALGSGPPNESGDKPVWINLTEAEFQALVVGLSFYANAAIRDPKKLTRIIEQSTEGTKIDPLPALTLPEIARLVDALAVWRQRCAQGKIIFQSGRKQ